MNEMFHSYLNDKYLSLRKFPGGNRPLPPQSQTCRVTSLNSLLSFASILNPRSLSRCFDATKIMPNKIMPGAASPCRPTSSPRRHPDWYKTANFLSRRIHRSLPPGWSRRRCYKVPDLRWGKGGGGVSLMIFTNSRQGRLNSREAA